jgi:hypothetical protein
LRAALDVAEPVEDEADCAAEQALVADVVIEAEAAAVAVDDVIGENVEDELDEEETEDDVPVVPGAVAATDEVVTVVPAIGVVVTMVSGVVDGMEICEVEVDDAAVEDVVVVGLGVVADDPVVDVLPTVGVEATTEAGEHAMPADAIVAGGPDTVPTGALVVCVPLADPPDVLTNMELRMSAFCQYCGAASMTTWYWLSGL